MAVATQNSSYMIGGPVELYLDPNAPFTGATLPLLETSAFSTFYDSKRHSINATYLGKQFGTYDDTGVDVKVKPTMVEANTQRGKIPVSFAWFDVTGSAVLFDGDASHIATLFGCTANEIIATAAATGQSGKTTIAIGSQVTIPRYTIMVRTLSGNKIVSAGGFMEFDNWLYPNCVITPEPEIKLTPKGVYAVKFNFQALPDYSLISPDSNQPIQAFFDTTTAAGL